MPPGFGAETVRALDLLRGLKLAIRDLDNVPKSIAGGGVGYGMASSIISQGDNCVVRGTGQAASGCHHCHHCYHIGV